MKNRANVLLTLFTICCVFSPLATAYATNSNPEAQPISISASLECGKTIASGEPIILRCSIANTSSEVYAVHLGIKNEAWYGLSLFDQYGHVAVIPSSDSKPGGASLGTPDVTLAPGEQTTKWIVVSSYFPRLNSGRYFLQVNTRLAYAHEESDDGPVIPSSAEIKSSGTALTNNIGFTLTVSPSSNSQLAAISEETAQEIVACRDPLQTAALLDGLLSMPAVSASHAWKTLADQGEPYTTYVLSGLADHPSDETVSMLDSIISRPNAKKSTINTAAQSLQQMYNVADDEVKTHIRSVAAMHGIPITDRKPLLITD